LWKQIREKMKSILKLRIMVQNIKGSWAGAMGQTQFMPTSFNAYSVDYNNDGRKDI